MHLCTFQMMMTNDVLQNKILLLQLEAALVDLHNENKQNEQNLQSYIYNNISYLLHKLFKAWL